MKMSPRFSACLLTISILFGYSYAAIAGINPVPPGDSNPAVPVCAALGAAGNAVGISGTLNVYFPGTADASSGSTSVTVGPGIGAAGGVSVGDLLLIIQMQDAIFDTDNNSTYGDGAGGGDSAGSTDIRSTGLYEFVVADSAITAAGGTITLTTALANSYNDGTNRRFQVVRVPTYDNLTLSGDLTATAWNGEAGGVIAVNVLNTLTLAGNGANANGVGFRGGIDSGGTGTGVGVESTSRRESSGDRWGEKGEGIAGAPSVGGLSNADGYPSGDYARGAPGTAGGGGNDHNGGGGGGSHIGEGGLGGDAWDSGSAGGYGGGSFAGYIGRLLIGGGGGAGHRNNTEGGTADGGAGGGLVMITAGSISGSGTFSANGADGDFAVQDGSGGGGAGGTVVIQSGDASLASLTVSAVGGEGGYSEHADPHGPGGGGSGGAVYTSAAVGSASVSGGDAGFWRISGVNQNNHGADDGEDGASSVVDLTAYPQACDFGDAPASYATASASHNVATAINGPNTLQIGATVDYEPVGTGSAATNDDVTGIGDDEDSTAFSGIEISMTESYLLAVTTANSSGSDAMLAAWLDRNCDGDFLDAGERARDGTYTDTRGDVVADSQTLGVVKWDGVDGLGDGGLLLTSDCVGETVTYARLRITSDADFFSFSSPSPTAVVADGEMEDYQVSLTTSTTPAVIASFNVNTGAQQTEIHWQTASEVQVAGFRIEHQVGDDWHNLGDQEWLPAAYAEQGADYALPVTADLAGEHNYRIVELTTYGQQIIHGPYLRSPQSQKSQSSGNAFSKQGLKLQRRLDVDKMAALQSQPGSRPQPVVRDAGGESVTETDGPLKLSHQSAGINRVPFTLLANLWGTTDQTISQWAAQGYMSLTTGGHDVAWVSDGKALYYYAEAADSLFTNQSVYVLEPDAKGLLMGKASSLVVSDRARSSYRAEQNYELDNIPVLSSTENPADDYWYWDVVVNSGNYVNSHFSLDISGGVKSHGRLTLGLLGASMADHQVKVSVNGVELGSTRFSNHGKKLLSFSVPGYMLIGQNLDITVSNASEGSFSVVYVDDFTLNYRRKYEADKGSILFDQRRKGRVSVDGLNAGERLLALDISQPGQPVSLGFNQSTDGQFSNGFSKGTYFVAGESAWMVPAISRLSAKPILDPQTEYLIVAPEVFMSGAQALESYRANDFATQMISIEAIYDHYGGGMPLPQALLEFLKDQAWNKGVDQDALAVSQLAYLTLIGDGSYDYRDIMGTGYNLLSPMMTGASGLGLVPNDMLLTDWDNDGLSDIPVGRIPVKTADELNLYINKLIAYESQAADQPRLLMTDNNDYAGDFGKSGDLIIDHARDIPNVLSLNDQDIESLREDFQSGLQGGYNMVQYIGHAGFDRLAAEGILTAEDIATMDNDLPPALVALSCNINNFVIPGFDGMAEHLLLDNPSGMVASWASVSLSNNGDAQSMGVIFEKHMPDYQRLGDAILSTHREISGSNPAYMLLGDPALKISN